MLNVEQLEQQKKVLYEALSLKLHNNIESISINEFICSKEDKPKLVNRSFNKKINIDIS
jgi:hypothetical protein